VKKVWEHRSHAFPPHYTPEYKLLLPYPTAVTYCVITQVNTVQLYLQAQYNYIYKHSKTL